jgi:hypothetical protein
MVSRREVFIGLEIEIASIRVMTPYSLKVRNASEEYSSFICRNVLRNVSISQSPLFSGIQSWLYLDRVKLVSCDSDQECSTPHGAPLASCFMEPNWLILLWNEEPSPRLSVWYFINFSPSVYTERSGLHLRSVHQLDYTSNKVNLSLLN